MADAQQILVVDDDPRVRTLLQTYLEGEGYSVVAAEDGAAMRQALAQKKFDLIFLDLVMPGEDGLSLARDIRSNSDVPIIVLSGKGKFVDRVAGLEVGADDYITKPFHLREVLARVRSVLRRSTTAQAPEATPTEALGDECLGFAGWRLDLTKRELHDPTNAPTALTTGEFNLLSAFVRHPNRPISRDQLMDLTRGQNWTPYDRSIDTQIGRLRKKLEADPKNPEIIKTVRGVGYLFTAKVEQTKS